jgi:hypothetical protein
MLLYISMINAFPDVEWVPAAKKKFAVVLNIIIKKTRIVDVIWCDVMRSDTVRCDAMFCSVLLCDMLKYDVMWRDVTWNDVVWCDAMRCDAMRCDVMWLYVWIKKNNSVAKKGEKDRIHWSVKGIGNIYKRKEVQR